MPLQHQDVALHETAVCWQQGSGTGCRQAGRQCCMPAGAYLPFRLLGCLCGGVRQGVACLRLKAQCQRSFACGWLVDAVTGKSMQCIMSAEPCVCSNAFRVAWIAGSSNPVTAGEYLPWQTPATAPRLQDMASGAMQGKQQSSTAWVLMQRAAMLLAYAEGSNAAARTLWKHIECAHASTNTRDGKSLQAAALTSCLPGSQQ